MPRIATPSPDEMLGRELGGYELKRVIGSGSTGTVYRAEHTVLRSQVALKILRPSFSTEPEIIQRFLKEARAVNLLAHDNVVKTFAFDVAMDGRVYLVMELLEGATLAEYVAGPTSLTAVAPVIYQVMDALAVAHDAGVAHGDLRPETVFVTHAPVRLAAKILDFGMGRLRSPAVDYDPRTDVLSLGKMLFWIATGRTLTGELADYAPHPSSVNLALPTSYDAVLMRALAHEPADRYQSMRDFSAGFELAVAMAGESPETAHSELRAPKRNLAETFDRIAFKPVPRSAGRKSELAVHLRIGSLDGFRRIYQMDIVHHGMFIASEEFLPPTETLIDVVIHAPDQTAQVRMAGRIVRLVTASDAAGFGGKQGMVVQLLDLDAEKRAQLERILHRETTPESTQSPMTQKNAKAAKVIDRYGGSGKSPYQLLQILPSASAAEIRSAVQAIRVELDPQVLGPVAEEQANILKRIRDQIDRAAALLLDPRTRCAHDAASSNYLGVAQALAAGLSIEELAQLRTQYLSTRWEAPATAKQLVREAMLAEYNNNPNEARIQLERALAIDPLDLEIHNRYWAMRIRTH